MMRLFIISTMEKIQMSDFKLSEFKPTNDESHRELVKRQMIFSCLNCISFTAAGKCLKYKATPPPTVIVYSCGPDWEGDLPF